MYVLVRVVTGRAVELRELEIRYSFAKRRGPTCFRVKRLMNENEYAPEDEGVLAADVSMARKLLYISIHAEGRVPR